MRMRHRTRIAAGAIALALVAAGCADEEPGATTDGGPVATTAPSGETSGEPTTDDGPLTASDTGVTETTITVGIPLVDVEALQEIGILQGMDGLDERGAWEAAIDRVNDRGGVTGRNIEAVYTTYLPLGVAQAEAACVELVQDNDIFAAIGGAVAPEAIPCYTELNGTPFIGASAALTPEVIDRSIELAVTTDLPANAVQDLMVGYALSEGAADKAVGVHGDDQSQIERVVGLLRDSGVDVVSITTVSAPETDAAARIGEYEQIFERWRSDGVEVVLNTGPSLDVLSAMGRQEFYVPFYAGDGTVYNYQPTEERQFEALRQVTALTGAPDVGEDHEPTKSCYDNWDTRHPDQLLDDIPEQAFPVGVACAAIELFVAIAEAAGTDLTHEALKAAPDQVQTVDVALSGPVRIGGDGPLGPDGIAIHRFDEDLKLLAVADSYRLE